MGISGDVKLLFSLLKYQQQGTFPIIESRVFQGFLDKFRFTGVQETGKGIYWDLHHILHPKHFRNISLIQLATDHAKFTDDRSRTHAHIVLIRNIVEVDPAAVSAGNNTLCAQNQAIAFRIQTMQRSFNFSYRKLLSCLYTPRGKHLIRMVVMVMAATTFMVLMLMMVATAALVVLVLMMVVTAALVVLVLMLMVMTATALVVLMLVVMTATALVALMLMMVATAALVVLVLMLMMLATTALVVLVLVMVVMMFLLQASQFSINTTMTFHSLQ